MSVACSTVKPMPALGKFRSDAEANREQYRAAIWRLDEQIEHIAAAVIRGVRRMRWPIDIHQSDRSDGMTIVFDDKAKISRVRETFLEPAAKRCRHRSELGGGPTRLAEHLLAMTTNEIEIGRPYSSCEPDRRSSPQMLCGEARAFA